MYSIVPFWTNNGFNSHPWKAITDNCHAIYKTMLIVDLMIINLSTTFIIAYSLCFVIAPHLTVRVRPGGTLLAHGIPTNMPESPHALSTALGRVTNCDFLFAHLPRLGQQLAADVNRQVIANGSSYCLTRWQHFLSESSKSCMRWKWWCWSNVWDSARTWVLGDLLQSHCCRKLMADSSVWLNLTSTRRFRIIVR